MFDLILGFTLGLFAGAVLVPLWPWLFRQAERIRAWLRFETPQA